MFPVIQNRISIVYYRKYSAIKIKLQSYEGQELGYAVVPDLTWIYVL